MKYLKIIPMLILLFFLVACERQEDPKPEPEEVIYTVTFDDLNGALITIEVKSGAKVTIPNEPKQDGFEFIEWQLDGKKFSFDTTITKDITLLAKWQEVIETITYTVTFNSNGGNSIASQVVENGMLAKKPLNPNYSGFEFISWQYMGGEFDFNTPITSNITLHASWQFITDISLKDDLKNDLATINLELAKSDSKISYLYDYEHFSHLYEYLVTDSYVYFLEGNHYIDNEPQIHLLVKDNDSYAMLIKSGILGLSNNYYNFSYETKLDINLFISELLFKNDNLFIEKTSSGYRIKLLSSDLNYQTFNEINDPTGENPYIEYLPSNLNYSEIEVTITDRVKISFALDSKNKIVYEYQQLNESLPLQDKPYFQIDEQNHENIYLKHTSNKYYYTPVSYGASYDYSYYAIELEAGYYDLQTSTPNVIFYDHDFNEITLETINNPDSQVERLIKIPETNTYYFKLTGFYYSNRTFSFEFKTYENFELKPTIIFTDSEMIFTDVSGGKYDPLIIDFSQSDYEYFHLSSNDRIDSKAINLKGTSEHNITLKEFNGYYKKESGFTEHLIKVFNKNVSFKIVGFEIENEIETTETNRYLITEEFSPVFNSASYIHQVYLELKVEKAGIYDLIFAGLDSHYYVYVNGSSKEFPTNLKVGTYKISVETSGRYSFEVKYQAIFGEDLDIEFEKPMAIKLYPTLYTTINFDLTNDTAFNLKIETDDHEYLEVKFYKDGIEYPYSHLYLENYYLKSGQYQLKMTSYAIIEIVVTTILLEIPTNTNYSFDYQKISSNQTINLESNLFGYFYEVDSNYLNNQNYYISGTNMTAYGGSVSILDKLTLSTSTHRFLYNHKYLFILPTTNATLTITRMNN